MAVCAAASPVLLGKEHSSAGRSFQFSSAPMVQLTPISHGASHVSSPGPALVLNPGWHSPTDDPPVAFAVSVGTQPISYKGSANRLVSPQGAARGLGKN